jgi:uncharacterized protein with ParB-like and HNH nuclease domain
MSLVSVKGIIDNKYKFFIPSYQRGYRWCKKEVEELLNDLAEFEINAKVDEFYCLQPLVVKKEGEYYRVVDGQQRLTTIYLILKALEDLLREDYGIDDFFSIKYETRSKSEEFLKDIKNKTEEDAEENIDFYFMFENYKFINEWLENAQKTSKITKRRLVELLLSMSRNEGVKFIWYELDNNEKEEEVFARLNIGKIPLTNAELIKAVLLLQIKENKEREILINEWDNIEQKLQDERFFGFLTKDEYEKSSKIEFIFDLIADSLDINFNYQDTKRKTFYILNEFIQNEEKAKEFWDKVKSYFRMFEEFYSDTISDNRDDNDSNNSNFYHLIGYLTNRSSSLNIKDIIDIYTNSKKDEFLNKLKNIIFKNFEFEDKTIKYRKNKDIDIEELTFSEHKAIISDILFLFNILISINSRFFRYPFDLHKKEVWSLEHINPQNPYELSDEEKEEMLKSYHYYVSEELQRKISNALEKKEYDEILKELVDSDDDSIGNLTLLSVSHNSKIGNKSFLQKRKEIIELDKNAEFVPPATKLVFLKYFSLNPSNLYKWDRNDKRNYIEELKEMFFKFKGADNGN